MLVRASSGSGGGGGSVYYTIFYGTSTYPGYHCLKNDGSADVVWSNSTASGTIVDDDYLNIVWNGSHNGDITVKKACNMITSSGTVAVAANTTVASGAILYTKIGFGLQF